MLLPFFLKFSRLSEWDSKLTLHRPQFFGKIWSRPLNRIHYTVKSCNQILNFREHVYLHIKKMSLKRLPTASNLHVKRRKCIQEISIYKYLFLKVYSFRFKCLICIISIFFFNFLISIYSFKFKFLISIYFQMFNKYLFL